MKNLLYMIAILAGCVFAGRAQVTVEAVLQQRQFLPDEALPVAVKITNRSGQRIHLGAEADWLTFSMESEDGFDVVKLAEVPVLGDEFDLETSQMATKHVDLGPYFSITKSGRYKIVATLRIKAWNAQTASAPVFFDVVHGTPLWTQDFGLPGASTTTAKQEPVLRTYSLLKVTYLTSQLRLYARVSDPVSGRVYKVTPVGAMVSFSAPEAQIDPEENLHVLYQSGASIFNYVVIDPQGNIFRQELYDYVATRPRLGVNNLGEITVIGGVRRLKPSLMPVVKMPAELPPPVKH